MLVIKVMNSYRKQVCIVHYAKVLGIKQIIEENTIITNPIERIVYKDDVVVYDVQMRITRARSRRGEVEYNLLLNNCESFVNWALTNENLSEQVERFRAVIEIFGIESLID